MRRKRGEEACPQKARCASEGTGAAQVISPTPGANFTAVFAGPKKFMSAGEPELRQSELGNPRRTPEMLPGHESQELEGRS
jgi:hypothetical protein